MSSDHIDFYAIKLSITNLICLIFLLKTSIFLSKKKKEGHEKEEILGEGDWILYIKICLLHNSLKI